MTVVELITTVILSNATWSMDAESGQPQLCIPQTLDDKGSYVCTQVPEEFLHQWLINNTIKV